MSLWNEFMEWFQSRFNVPGGVAVADDDNFGAWLMSRFGIPGG